MPKVDDVAWMSQRQAFWFARMMISRSPHSSSLARPRRRPRKRRCKRSWRPALRRWATRSRERAIDKGWLTLHASGTYVKFTPAGAELFA
jgi:hypothetical protein